MADGMKPTRDGFGEGILELGRTNPDVFVLSGDVAGSTRADWFGKQFPDRFLNMGISEQDMIGTAVGLSLAGKVPFVCSFSVFICCRAYDQIRVSVCYNNQNVKILGSHSGITVGPDGATAQALEDIAQMRVLPNMKVIVPADAIEAKKATIAAASIKGPVYLRVGRGPVPIVTDQDAPFEIGRANVLRDGEDITIIAFGIMVNEALKASDEMKKESINACVINMHTIKPLDERTIISAVKKTKAVVTAEEHQINGGLGGAVAECLCRACPVPLEMVAVNDTFGESGEPGELMERYQLTYKDIIVAAKRALRRKKEYH